MDIFEEGVFIKLFNHACKTCFGKPPLSPLTEAESKHLSHDIQERTGLAVGWKSLKNYSLYTQRPDNGRKENPSLATLDTLCRYINNAEKTDETTRKRDSSHYPYWFSYLEDARKPAKRKAYFQKFWWAGIIPLLLVVFFLLWPVRNNVDFNTGFERVSDDSLRIDGWKLSGQERTYWKRNNEKSGHLTLFTLFGDNYDTKKGLLKNLLYREITLECFTTEVQFSGFMPEENWQQAGILLFEDTLMVGRNVRISLAYNDFFGGYQKPGEIIIQTVHYDGDSLRKPEEMAHVTLFSREKSNKEIVENNLRKSAIRIEKSGTHFRFLFASGEDNIFGFKQILEKDIDFVPKYVGLFALKGHVREASVKPVYVDFFSIKEYQCK